MKTSKMKIYEQPTIKVVKFHVELGLAPSVYTDDPGTGSEDEWVGRSVEGTTSRSVFDNTAAFERSLF